MTRPEFRRSQGIVPFGVGAIIDFPDESLMAAGLDAWLIEMQPEIAVYLKEATYLSEPRLQTRLSYELGKEISGLYMPPEAPEYPPHNFAGFGGPITTGDTPFVRFPNWHFCPRCRSMQYVPWNSPSNAKNEDLRCKNSKFRRQAKANTQPCSALPLKRRPKLVPVRFIVACTNGHISDFPWSKWAHGARKECGHEPGTLFLVSTGGAGLEGIKVECSKCGSFRTMKGAFNPNTFMQVTGLSCSGARPWLGPQAHELNCQESAQVVQRGASNVYFPHVVSSILIPPYSETIHRILDNQSIWSEICDVLDNIRVNGQPVISANMFTSKANKYGIEPEVLAAAIKEKYLHPEAWSGTADQTESAYRFTERQAFLGPRPAPNERHEFDIRKTQISDYSREVKDYFDEVVLIPRLRETRALVGFSRVTPFDGDQSRLSKLSKKELSWLPAVSSTGEGIYLELSEEKLCAWESAHADISARIDLINRNWTKVSTERGTSFDLYCSRVLLAHTLSHLIIRQLSFDCGYDSSTLKERLYVSNDAEQKMCGILIYTAGGDSEGSLGGLVRQGETGNLESTILAAVRNAQFCASDPLCLDSEGQGYYGMNLAACHACTLLPETACELGNRVLDRAMVIGSETNPLGGYFSDLTL
ncbi:DUF1998 domain-containing protein [Aliikangiella coralliicola]|uniref:DUF1998 domain-containing protein n=1 Tax=Aliikangiella coralliicola TaxID=2592383 RepID=A0A545UDX3_9GAMM|nr:DUF1998 domain-containing protein [Aliikangiella coralliicola]TQV87669.1 DUF1998 domain-containing protein [Aliikangiella coralliicola]